MYYVFSAIEFFIVFILKLEPLFDCRSAMENRTTYVRTMYTHYIVMNVYVMFNCIELYSIHLSILARLLYLCTLFHFDNGGLLFFNTKIPCIIDKIGLYHGMTDRVVKNFNEYLARTSVIRPPIAKNRRVRTYLRS